MKTLLTLIAVCVALTALAFIAIQPCKTEDSSMCYWNASQHGNGQGTSFYSISENNVILFK